MMMRMIGGRSPSIFMKGKLAKGLVVMVTPIVS